MNLVFVCQVGLECFTNFLDDLGRVADPAAQLVRHRQPLTVLVVIFPLHLIGVELRVFGEAIVEGASRLLLDAMLDRSKFNLGGVI